MGIQQIFALSPQAKGRVERMVSTFQDRLVTELRLAGAATMDQANTVLQEFLPRFNARFSVTAEQPETAYRRVLDDLSLTETVSIQHTGKVARDNTVQLAQQPETAYRRVLDDLSLTETVSIQHTGKVARDNTVHYQWRVLQLLPGAERPSYAGLQVEVLERADGELMIKYQGATVEFQEGDPPASALWREGTGRSSIPEGSGAADDQTGSHLDETQQKPLADLESSVEKRAKTKAAASKGKPLRHQLHRKPTATQQARWEAVHQAKLANQSIIVVALSLPVGSFRSSGSISSSHTPSKAGDCPCVPSPENWACHGWPPENMPWQRVPLPSCSAPRSGPRPRPWSNHRWPPTNLGDIFAFQNKGRNRWTTTHFTV